MNEKQEHTHLHIHSSEEKKLILNRLSKATGHLEAVKKMIDSGKDCSEVLISVIGCEIGD